jgi:hypothetical protein
VGLFNVLRKDLAQGWLGGVAEFRIAEGAALYFIDGDQMGGKPLSRHKTQWSKSAKGLSVRFRA